MIQTFKDLDAGLFFSINSLNSPWADYFLGWPTFLATPFAFYIALLLILIWDTERPWKRFFMVLAGGAGGALLANLFKVFFHRPRPMAFFHEDIVQGKVVVNNLFANLTTNSFPSSHAALIFAVAVAVNLVYKNKFLFLYPLALILAFTRVYVGAHFPSDVVGGAVIGGFGSYFVLRILKNYLKPEPPA